MDKKSFLIAILLFLALACVPTGEVRGATYYTVTIDVTGIDVATSSTAVTFMGTNVAVSQLPRQFSVANATNATYSWQQYISVNSTYRYVFVNAVQTVLVETCHPSVPPLPPICLSLPFSTNISRTGSITVTSNTTISANYSPEFYLQYSVPTGGWANLTSGWYGNASSITISASPNSGYSFDKWITTGSVSVSNPNSSVTTLTINGPGTVTAVFLCYVQFSSQTGGSLNATTGWYPLGTAITISASPNSGYSFDKWITTGSVSVSNPNSSVTTLTINGPGTVTSLFAAAPPSGIPMEYLLGIIGLVVVIAALGIAMMRRKPKPPPAPKPTSLRLTPLKGEIFADGRSSTEIAVELIDSQGKPVASDSEREVRLTATDGNVQPAVTIPKGASSAKASLSSSLRVGTVTVSATSRDLTSATATVSFIEKKRYCMVCGQRMPLDARTCPSCGSAPPSGADTKTCPNCGAVIPVVAKFCSECGASQYNKQ